MMGVVKPFEELKSTAERVYQQIRDEDRDHATLTILEALTKEYCDGQKRMLDEVEIQLLTRGLV